MYHYLKWAALSLFIKRNAKYLLLILVSLLGIYIGDAIYEDMADFLAKSGRSEEIARYLLMKWVGVLLFAGVILWSIMRLGFAKKKNRSSKKEREDLNNDPYMQRLEKFKTKDSLRSKSDMVIESRKKEKI